MRESRDVLAAAESSSCIITDSGRLEDRIEEPLADAVGGGLLVMGARYWEDWLGVVAADALRE